MLHATVDFFPLLLPSGDSFVGDIPLGSGRCAHAIERQSTNADAGVATSVSFTRGLELVLEH